MFFSAKSLIDLRILLFFPKELPSTSGNPPPMYRPSQAGTLGSDTGLKNFNLAPSLLNASKLSL